MGLYYKLIKIGVCRSCCMFMFIVVFLLSVEEWNVYIYVLIYVWLVKIDLFV